MANFPKLIPAFTAQIQINEPSVIGKVGSGNTLVHVPFVPNSGSLVSEPSYPLKVDAFFSHGGDFIRHDVDGEHVRLQVSSLAKDKRSGAFIHWEYTGTVSATGAAGKVLTGHPDAATSDFGEIFTIIKFETGSEELKGLGSKVYVGSGRFIVEKGKPTIVEYKISEVSN